jgi:hypothetical protein
MNEIAKVAFDRPVPKVGKLGDKEFAWKIRRDQRTYTAIVALFQDPDENAALFEGLPHWSVTLMLHGPHDGFLVTDLWPEDAKAAAPEFFHEALQGCGDPTGQKLFVGSAAFHFKRRCSDTELGDLRRRGLL